MDTVVVLNYDYNFLNVIPWERAMTLLVNQKVEVIECHNRDIKSEKQTFRLPKVVRLLKYIKNFYKKMTIKFNRRNVFLRDSHECGYCLSPGNNKNKLTIDHIIPRCRNGEHSFENTVTCCNSCNGKKKNKTPEEAGMILKKRIYEPTFYDLFKDKVSMYTKN